MVAFEVSALLSCVVMEEELPLSVVAVGTEVLALTDIRRVAT
jgi:hypothetical protein